MSDQAYTLKEVEKIYSKSVTEGDLGKVYENGGVIRMVLPFFAPGQSPYNLTIPPQPPAYWSYQRDFILRATVLNEAMWAAAIGIAITKMASLAFNVDSVVPKRAKAAQEILLNADGSRMGWVGFIAKHLRDFLTTDNGAFIEIVRESSAIGSKIVGIRHLDSVRCTRTGDPEYPVVFRDRMNKYHQLRDYQVITLSDMPDPGDTYFGVGLCAASRAYNAIYKLSTTEWYLREKIGGLRPLAIYIVNGVLDKQLKDAIDIDKQDLVSRGVAAYMGATIIGVPGDKPPSVVTIPLAELPDRFNRKEEFDIAILTYADSIGLDLQDLQPLTGGMMGTGTQSQVLSEKSKGKGLAAWRQAFTHGFNQYVLDDLTNMVFIEKDYRDQEAKAGVAKARAEVSKIRIDGGITTPDQELQVLVDMDELPKEFLPEDKTPGDSLSDTDKPEQDEAEEEGTAAAKPGDRVDPAAAKKPAEGAKPEAKVSKDQPAGKIAQKPAQGQGKASKETYKDYSGAMTAVFVPEDLADEIYLDQDGALPPEDLHVTLNFLGDISGLTEDQHDAASAAISGAVVGMDPFEVTISGIGRFTKTSDPDGKHAVYLSVDSPGLNALHEKIGASLEGIGIAPEMNHGFTPHITLAYLDPGEETPVIDIPDESFMVDGASLAWGDERETFPFVVEETQKATKGAVEEAISRLSKIMASAMDKIKPKKKEVTLKHLTGQHDQKTHGWRGGAHAESLSAPAGGPLLSRGEKDMVYHAVKGKFTEGGRSWSEGRRKYLYDYITWVSNGKSGSSPNPKDYPDDVARAASHIRRSVEGNAAIKALGVKKDPGTGPKPPKEVTPPPPAKKTKPEKTGDPADGDIVGYESYNPKAGSGRDKIEANTRKYLLEMIERNGFTEAELDESIELYKKTFRKIAEECDVNIGLNEGALEAILKGGRYKTQFESRSSGGYYSPSTRARAENKGMGTPESIDPKLRPVYGYVSHAWAPSDGYGTLRITLKKDVKDRTSWTYEDSLGAMGDGHQFPSPLKKPMLSSMGSYYYGINFVKTMESMKNYATTPAEAESVWANFFRGKAPGGYGVSYLETQIHGGVKVSDIAAIHVPRGWKSYGSGDEIIKKAKELGIEIFEDA